MDFKKYIGIIFTIVVIITFLSCSTSTVTMVNEVESYTKKDCTVTVYKTKKKAEESGDIEEICIVSGSSAFSFDHSIEGAIKKNIPEICKCGVTSAYLKSMHRESEMGLKGESHVTLVGFKYSKKKE